MGTEQRVVSELVVRLLLETNFKDVLNAASTASSRAGEELNQVLSGVKAMNAETTKGSVAAADNAKAIAGQTESLKTGRAAYREFLTEQRFSNRMARESTQALTAIALATSFFNDQQGEASQQTKAFSQSMVAGVMAMNAAEFSAFTLGNSLLGLGGKIGGLGILLTRFSGPLGIMLGAVSALTAYIATANDEGSKASDEGIGLFINKMKSVSARDLTFMRDALTMMKQLREQAEALPQALSMIPSATAQGPLRAFLSFTREAAKSPLSAALGVPQTEDPEREKLINGLDQEIKRQEILNEFETKARNFILERGNLLQRLNAQLEEVNEKLRGGVLVDEQGRSLVEERVRLTRELAELLKTADDRQAERISAAEAEYQLERITRAELIGKLEAELKTAQTAERRRAIQLEIAKLTKEEAKALQDINAYWQEGAFKAQEQFETASKQLSENRAQLEIDRIRDAADKKIAEENRRYQAQLALINDLEMKTQDHDEAAAQRRLAAEINRQNIVAIGQQKELSELQLVADQVGVIGSALHNAFSGAGSDLLQKMIAIAQIALQVAKTIQMMNAGQLSGPLGPLSLIASGLGIFGLFDRGGYTGSGKRYEPAGIVHRGEIVFEKPIVDRYGDTLMGLRSMMQRSYAGGGVVGTGASFGLEEIQSSVALQRHMLSGLAVTKSGVIAAGNSADLGQLIMEIRGLSRRLDERVGFPDRVKVDLDNGEMFLRHHDRSLQRWRASKQRRAS